MEWVNEFLHGSEIFNWIVRIYSTLGDYALLWIGFGIFLLCKKEYRKYALVFFISLGTGFLLNDMVLKKLVMRERPFQQSEVLKTYVDSYYYSISSSGFINFLTGSKYPSGSSFPSGHSFCAANAATFLFLIDKKKLGIPAIVLAALMALSRIFMCVHFPTDVLTGLILGTLLAVAAFKIYEKIMKVKELNKEQKKEESVNENR